MKLNISHKKPQLKKEYCFDFFIIALIFFSCIFSAQAQVDFTNIPFPSGDTEMRVNGDVLMTGNTILGYVNHPGSTPLHQNDPYDFDNNNGDRRFPTAYSDIDSNRLTFSSSSAFLEDPNVFDPTIQPNCSTVEYAALFWAGSYYMMRYGNPNFPILTINNSKIAGVRDATLILTTPTAGSTTEKRDLTKFPVSTNLVVASSVNGCTNITNATGNIVVIDNDTTSCSIKEKILKAQEEGALAVIIVPTNTNPLNRITDTNEITIPSVYIDDTNLISQIKSVTDNVINATLSNDYDPVTSQFAGFTFPPDNEDPRKRGNADFRNIMFGPDQNYQNITGNVIFDGYANSATVNPDPPAPNTARRSHQYACYADVTQIVRDGGFNKNYFAANIKATVGRTSGGDGSSAGWTLVVVYKNPASSFRFITLFEGFKEIRGTPATFDINGFRTLPAPFDVRVKIGVSSLEGDRSIPFDRFNIDGTAAGVDWRPLGDGTGTTNPTDNFFNSSITVNNKNITKRNPNSKNTLGYDADFVDLTEPNKSKDYLGNNQTSATFQLHTTGDHFMPYMSVFSIEDIEPRLSIIKRVFDRENGDNQIVNTTTPVPLNTRLLYELEIKNIGNEELRDGTITVTDLLPENTVLTHIDDQSATFGALTPIPSGPNTGISYIATQVGERTQVVFHIPKNHVLRGRIDAFILKIETRITNDCTDLLNAESNIIINQATATYTGDNSGLTRNSTSGIGFTDACGNIQIGQTRVCVNVEPCPTTQPDCSVAVLTVTAGTSFGSYMWTYPKPLADGSTTSTTTTNELILGIDRFVNPNDKFGVYTVQKNQPTGFACSDLTEKITVTPFDDIKNPLETATIDNTSVNRENFNVCEDGLVKFNECGNNGFTINIGLSAVITTIEWFRLGKGNPTECYNREDDCPIVSIPTCNVVADLIWESMSPADAITQNLTINDPGEYRVHIVDKFGCDKNFYFDVNMNHFQPRIETPLSLRCGENASIRVLDIPVPGDYLYSLVKYDINRPDPTNGSGFLDNNGVFNIVNSDNITTYVAYVVHKKFPNCVYRTNTMNVTRHNPTPTIVPHHPKCLGDHGSIDVTIADAGPIYNYILTDGTGAIIRNEDSNSNTHSFDALAQEIIKYE